MKADLFNWADTAQRGDTVAVWRPEPLTHEQWPPDYRAVYAWRIKTLRQLKESPQLIPGVRKYYASRPGEFIMHWMDTYNPRKASMKWIPFVFFMKQADVIDFFQDLSQQQESGLIEKCRDAGATWLACGYSVHRFLFVPHDSIGWGSRKANLVDKLGDADSIFEKMRLIMRRLPPMFLPNGWTEKKHATYMRFVNPENGSSITGEAGDNIGRGGRKAIYFKDESAHYERPELIEAALGDNTNVQIDISSVNGLGNAFHKRRVAGVEWARNKPIETGYTRIMVIDWRDHPEKDQEWYDRRRAKHEREGLLHIFAQEVDRDYAAAVSNVIIPKNWLLACIDAHVKLGWDLTQHSVAMAGLDVADGGVDRNGLVIRTGLIARHAEEWGERDPGVTTRRVAVGLRPFGRCKTMYDSIGVGSSVKSEYNRLVEDGILDATKFQFVPWNAGAGVINPEYRVIEDDEESIKNDDMFHNIKAQAWWSMRTRVYKTFRMVEALQLGAPAARYPVDELISFDAKMPLLYQLIDELAQPVKKESSRLKMLVDKQPDGMKSPNLGDGCVMCYFPIEDQNVPLVGHSGV